MARRKSQYLVQVPAGIRDGNEKPTWIDLSPPLANKAEAVKHIRGHCIEGRARIVALAADFTVVRETKPVVRLDPATAESQVPSGKARKGTEA
ncbi:MAG: hypothetical protein PHU85_03130 [Phycisphaerae bacterium]|nr:hypothetical protein [Phycisphaerae bacterium]